MMEYLRTTVNHIVFQIIFGLIMISFVLTGIGDYFNFNDSDYAAKINGQQISHAQLEQAIQSEYDRLYKSMKEDFSLLITNKSYVRQIRQQVLSQLINEVLLSQYVDTLGLAVSDDQIKQVIVTIPVFHTDNKFDKNKFYGIIGNMGLTPDQYASLIRKQLLIQQFIQGISDTVFLSSVETDRLQASAFQTREVQLAIFDISILTAKQTANDDEILAHYNAYKNNYISPEMFKVSYIPMDLVVIQKKINVDEQEIQDWYDHHQDQYIVPARKRYSIIQSKTEDAARSLLQQGGDFFALAKTQSSDVIFAKDGGDIGWISDDDDTISELKQANLSKKGQLSDVISSSMGFLIIRLDDIQPLQVKTLSVVYDDIVAKVKQEKAMKIYYALQQKVSEAVNNDKETLISAAIVSGMQVMQTDWFSRDTVPTELNSDAVKEVLFSGLLLNSNNIPGNNSDIIIVDDNRSIVIRLADYKSKSIKLITEVREQVEQEIKQQKALEQARINAHKFLTALKQGEKPIIVLKNSGLNFSAPQIFDSVNQDDPLVQTIFTLPQPQQNKVSYGMSNDSKGNIVLVALNKVIPYPLDMHHRILFINQLRKRMADITLNMLLDNLRSTANIKITAGIEIE